MSKAPSFLRSLCIPLLFSFLFVSCTENPPLNPDDDPEPVLTDKEILAKFLTIDLDNLPNYATLDFPAHYRTNQVQGNINSPQNNPITDIGASLGRVLFYDTQLSLNNTTSCASCHSQETGFTDVERFSIGFENGLTGSHSMRLANASFYSGARMFWDKRAEDIEDQSTQPIQDGIEMGFIQTLGGMDSLIKKLEDLSYYPILFEAAFGSESINEARIQKALAQFIRSMVSFDSKFDEGYAAVFSQGQGNNNNGLRDDFPNFTAEENLGKALYMGNGGGRMGGGNSCNTCHQAPTFALTNNSRSNGLDAGETVVFKSPSLKNLALVGSYMHDGRFGTLRDVIDHYADGIQTGPALDQRLRQAGPGGPGGQGEGIRINLNNAEREAMVAFLETLTDQALLSDEKFADPFK